MAIVLFFSSVDLFLNGWGICITKPRPFVCVSAFHYVHVYLFVLLSSENYFEMD